MFLLGNINFFSSVAEPFQVAIKNYRGIAHWSEMQYGARISVDQSGELLNACVAITNY